MALFTTTPASEMMPTPVKTTEKVPPKKKYPSSTPPRERITDVKMMKGADRLLNCATMITKIRKRAKTKEPSRKPTSSCCCCCSPVNS